MSYLKPGEPAFTIRGQDPDAGAAVRAWAGIKAAAGAPAAVIEQALQTADALDAWPGKKPTDDGHLSEHDRKQLAYQLSRRAWKADLAWTDAVRRAESTVAFLRALAKSTPAFEPELATSADAVEALLAAEAR